MKNNAKPNLTTAFGDFTFPFQVFGAGTVLLNSKVSGFIGKVTKDHGGKHEDR